MWDYCQYCDYAKMIKKKVSNECGIMTIEVPECKFKTVKIHYPLCFSDIFIAAEMRWLREVKFENN